MTLTRRRPCGTPIAPLVLLADAPLFCARCSTPEGPAVRATPGEGADRAPGGWKSFPPGATTVKATNEIPNDQEDER